MHPYEWPSHRSGRKERAGQPLSTGTLREPQVEDRRRDTPVVLLHRLGGSAQAWRGSGDRRLLHHRTSRAAYLWRKAASVAFPELDPALCAPWSSRGPHHPESD